MMNQSSYEFTISSSRAGHRLEWESGVFGTGFQELIVGCIDKPRGKAVTEGKAWPVHSVATVLIQIPGGTAGLPHAAVQPSLYHPAVTPLAVFPRIHCLPRITGQRPERAQL